MKIFDYTYYRICDFYKKKNDSSAEMTGSLIVSLIQFFTILDLFVITKIFWEFPIPEYFTKYWFVPIIIIILIINWNKYVKPKKYREYRKIWKDEYAKLRKKNGLMIILYLVISILIPILYGLIRKNIMEGKNFFG